MRASDRIGFSALGVIVAILAGCTGEGRQSEAVGAGSTVTEESGATAGRRAAGDSLPAAVLGIAPLPRGEPPITPPTPPRADTSWRRPERAPFRPLS